MANYNQASSATAVCRPGTVFQTQMGFHGQQLFLKLETNQRLSLLHERNRNLRQTSFTVAKSPYGIHASVQLKLAPPRGGTRFIKYG